MLLRPHRRRDKGEILLQQDDDLIHVQAEIGDGLPVGEVVVGDELVPAPQLVRHQILVVLHKTAPLLFTTIYCITNDMD